MLHELSAVSPFLLSGPARSLRTPGGPQHLYADTRLTNYRCVSCCLYYRTAAGGFCATAFSPRNPAPQRGGRHHDRRQRCRAPDR